MPRRKKMAMRSMGKTRKMKDLVKSMADSKPKVDRKAVTAIVKEHTDAIARALDSRRSEHAASVEARLGALERRHEQILSMMREYAAASR